MWDSNTRPPVETLGALINPRSIAIIGASNDPSRIGGRPISYIKRSGFKGTILPVNPNRDVVQDLPAYKSVADLPEVPDACIVAVPAPLVAETLEACVAKGIKAAVIFSSGFAEMGEDGAEAQDRLRLIARRGGMRILGPNCLGLFNAHNGWMATFSSSIENEDAVAGPVAVASQSGAYGTHVFALLRKAGVGTGTLITTGNEADVDIADCIAYLADDPNTRVIVGYAEGIRDGDALRAALAKAAAAKKPVILMKVGRSEVGAAAAASHTAALAGSDRIYDALFRQYGVMRVDSTDQMVDAAYAAAKGVYPAGDRIGLMTISGGVGVQMADAAIAMGLDVAPMPEKTQAHLKELLPFAATRNPVDITAQAFNDISLISENMRIMLEEGDYDAVVAFFTMIASSKFIADDLIATLSETSERFPDKVMLLSLIGSPEIVRYYEDGGYLVFEDPTRAVAAASALMGFGRFFARADEPGPADPPAAAAPVPAGPLSEADAMAVLTGWGVPFVRHAVAETPDEAARIAGQMAGRVVVKIVSPDILHKTEVGGVVVGVEGATAVRQAAESVIERARAAEPVARIDGVMVAEMAPEGVEVVVGVQRDPTFGPVVMVGLGGILVEVLEDVAFRLAPFGIAEAHRMIRELRGAKILDGVRGAGPSDVDALARLLSDMSVFAADQAGRIESVDLNPVRVLAKGRGLVALDALIVGAER